MAGKSVAKATDLPADLSATMTAIAQLAPQLAPVGTDDPDAINAQIAERVQNADSLDALFGNTAVSMREVMEDKPFVPTSVTLHESDQYGGYFAVVNFRIPSGEELVGTIGAPSVVHKLAVMAVRGWLNDQPVMIFSTLTKNNREVYDLQRVPLEEWRAAVAKAEDPEAF